MVVAGLLLLLHGTAQGDGGLFSRLHDDVWEPEQAAIVLHDPEQAREDLILRVRFEGSARDFGWIVPVPALPEVAEASPELFWESASLTRPHIQERGIGCGARSSGMDGPPTGDGVDVYDEGDVGVFHSMVVGSTDAAALTDSLTRWGFLHTENRDRAEEALRFYTERSWFFAVFRIDSTAVQGGDPGSWYGVLQPVRLSFQAVEPVYPLRISALSAGEENEVLLYVCAAHRVTIPGGETEYANRISSPELAAIRERYPMLGSHLTGGVFLTKLRRTYTPAEMTADLTLEPALTDDEFRPVIYTRVPVAELLLFGGAGTAVVLRWLRRRRDARNGCT
jgi:hypothetical protein